jgi:hypothetical protein
MNVRGEEDTGLRHAEISALQFTSHLALPSRTFSFLAYYESKFKLSPIKLAQEIEKIQDLEGVGTIFNVNSLQESTPT